MPNTSGMVLGIIGGCLSIFLGIFYSTEGAGGAGIVTILGILKLCMLVGGIIAIVGGAKANSNPKQARILLILGGIIAAVNIISIIAGGLVKESELVPDQREDRTIEETSPLGSDYKFCAHCGARIPRETNFCEFCGLEDSPIKILNSRLENKEITEEEYNELIKIVEEESIEEAIVILKSRLARGEITKEVYEDLKDQIED